MNFSGVILGVAAFLSIGVFHPIVIACEYHFTYKCWPVFLAAGLLLLGFSIKISEVTLSAAFGVVGCSCLWSIVELFEQRKRVQKGWFPKNPRYQDNDA